MKVLDILTKETWIQVTMARDSSGDRCEPNDPEACQWCLYGAIKKVYGKDWVDITHKVRKYLGVTSLILWSDDWNRQWWEVENLIKETGI